MKKVYRGFVVLEEPSSGSAEIKQLVYRGVKHSVDPALISYPDGRMKVGVYRGVRWAA